MTQTRLFLNFKFVKPKNSLSQNNFSNKFQNKIKYIMHGCHVDNDMGQQFFKKSSLKPRGNSISTSKLVRTTGIKT